jgi:hypothetical protein
MLAVVFCISCESASDRYVTEHYLIANQIESDIVVEFNDDGDRQEITIPAGETLEVDSDEIRYEHGMEYSRVWNFSEAEMRIEGEIVPEFIWGFEYWNGVSEAGADDYHSSLMYTLPVTDELLETVATRQASITRVTTDLIIDNQIESDITVELNSGEKYTISPGEKQSMNGGEVYYAERDDIEIPRYGLVLSGDLKIDEKVVKYIFWSGYWEDKFEYGEDKTCYRTRTLTVTDELLEEVKKHKG